MKVREISAVISELEKKRTAVSFPYDIRRLPKLTYTVLTDCKLALHLELLFTVQVSYYMYKYHVEDVHYS